MHMVSGLVGDESLLSKGPCLVDLSGIKHWVSAASERIQRQAGGREF